MNQEPLMEYDRREYDQHLMRLEGKIDRQDKRMDEHEVGEFQRYERMIEAAEAALLLAQKNEERLNCVLNELKDVKESVREPLEAYHTGKSGVLIIKTSGAVVKWMAGVIAAGAAVWGAWTHLLHK